MAGKKPEPDYDDLSVAFRRLERTMAHGDTMGVAREALEYALAYCRQWRGRDWFEKGWGQSFRRALGVRRG